MEPHASPGPPERPTRLTLDDLLAELLRQTREIVGVRDGLWRLIEAVVKVASAELTLASVLLRVVEVAGEMVDAEYAALGVVSQDGGLSEFVHTGMDAEAVARIGHLPEGHGILGLLISDPQDLRLDDLSAHPASVGFPEHHPPMDSFLGVPITVRGEIYGNLYLTNKHGGRGFTHDDMELVKTLAAAAGVVIDNARLHDVAVRRQRWLEATRDLTAALLGGADADRVQALIAERARELGYGATSTLALVDGDALTVVAADGAQADELRGAQFDLQGSASADVLESRRGRALDELPASDPVAQRLTTTGGCGPAMIVPLGVRDQALATLTVARRKGQPSFTAAELRAAEDLAAQAALALDYDHAQSQRRRAAIFTDRDRIGHDLHDLVIQRLFATGLELDSLTARIADPVAVDRMRAAVDGIDAAIADLRSSIFGLHMRRSGLSTVTRQVEEICRTATATLGFAPTRDIDPTVDGAVPDEVVVDLLAAVRELLSNVSRHADASHVTIGLHVTDDALRLEVADDGRGISAGGRRSGLANVSARAERLGGSMQIDSDASGTRITWHAPLG